MTRWRLTDYNRFRCGLSFKAIRQELQAEQFAAKQRGENMYVTRRTVLGRMRYYKLQAYEFSGGVVR